jgi:parallel beta-helix repeat protein
MSTSGVKLDPTLVHGSLEDAAPAIVDEVLAGRLDGKQDVSTLETDIAGKVGTGGDLDSALHQQIEDKTAADIPDTTTPIGAALAAAYTGRAEIGASVNAATLHVVPGQSAALLNVYPTLNAAAAAAAAGSTISLAPGTHSASPVTFTDLDGISIHGVGASVTFADTTDSLVAFVNCSDIAVTGVRFTGSATARNSTNYGLRFTNCSNFRVVGNTVTATSAAGIFIQGSTDFTVTGNNVFGTLADGIHVNNNGAASARFAIVGNTVSNTGDDSIAVVGYATQPAANTGCTIVGNVVTSSSANGITISGCTYAVVDANFVRGTKSNGIRVYRDTGWNTYGSSHVTVSNNIVVEANTISPTVQNFGILVASADAVPVEYVTVANNQVIASRYIGIGVGSTGGTTRNLSVNGNTVNGTTLSRGIYLSDCSNIDLRSNVVNQAATGGIFTTSSVTGYLRAIGNTVTDADTTATASTAAINIGSPSASVTFDANTVIDTLGNISLSWNLGAVTDLNYGSTNRPAAGKAVSLPSDPSSRPHTMQSGNTEANAAPTTGTWNRGDRVWNTQPTAGGTAGWVCVTSGSPGTWKTFGVIGA